MGAVSGPGGEITNPNGTAFDPSTYLPPDIAKSAKAAGGRDPENPTQVPARLFRRSTYLVATLWFLGVLPQEVFNQWVAKPLMTDIIIQQVDNGRADRRRSAYGCRFGCQRLARAHSRQNATTQYTGAGRRRARVREVAKPIRLCST